MTHVTQALASMTTMIAVTETACMAATQQSWLMEHVTVHATTSAVITTAETANA